MKADREEMMATLRSGLKEIFTAITGASWESIEAREEKVKALPETTEACPEVTHACLEKEEEQAPEVTEAVEEPQEILDGVMEVEEEPTPEETEVVAEVREVPDRATDEETGKATEDQTGELRLPVRRRRQRKKRAQENGGPRQKFAAFRGQVTRRAVPVLRKGGLPRRPGKKCRSGVRGRSITSQSGKRGRTMDNVIGGTPKGRTCEKRRWTQPRCHSGMKGRGTKQRPHLGRGKPLNEVLGQTFGLEVMEQSVGSSTRLPTPSIWLLWKCRPPPKRKR
jgi:hypothetical protein